MSNLIGLYPMADGTLDGAPQTFTSNTNDLQATVVATGYFSDKSQVMKGRDYINIIVDEDGTPALVRGVIVDTGTVEVPILTLDIAADIENGTITEAKLDNTSIKSFAVSDQLLTTAGGAATENVVIAGVLATDRVYAIISKVGSTPVTLTRAEAKAGSVDLVFSADPAADHIINLMVTRTPSN